MRFLTVHLGLLIALCASVMKLSAALPLFNAYPDLATTLPHLSLGNFPTPVQKLEKLGAFLGADNLWIKRDDLSGKRFGGNKIRKLEFLLADAVEKGYKGILTRGFAGSNHVCATADLCNQCNLDCVCILGPQRNTSYLQRNLKLDYYWGAEQHYFVDYTNKPLRDVEIKRLDDDYFAKNGSHLYQITAGGSDVIGTVGFVNAAFELKEQITAGLMPEPDYIYLPMGSCGTAAGLVLGLRAAGLNSIVVPVCVEEEENPTHLSVLLDLVRSVNARLNQADASFPLVAVTQKELPVTFDFVGVGYAAIPDADREAVKLLWELEGIKIDGTYAGKALAGLIGQVRRSSVLKDKVILFWDTFCSGSFDEIVNPILYSALPKEFHYFYEMPLEEGDQGV